MQAEYQLSLEHRDPKTAVNGVWMLKVEVSMADTSTNSRGSHVPAHTQGPPISKVYMVMPSGGMFGSILRKARRIGLSGRQSRSSAEGHLP